MDALNIVASANELINNHTKKEIVLMARSMGWRGDDARAPILQIALYAATKLNAGQRDEKHEGEKRQPKPMEGKLPDWMQSRQEGDQQADNQEEGTDTSDDSQGQQAEGQEEGQQEGQEGDQQAEGREGDQQESQEGDQQAEGQEEGQQESQESDQQESQEGDQQAEGQEGDQQEEDDEYAEPDGEFVALVKAAGLKNPHPLLEKVWRLATKAKQNVLLIGPAGCGKTMISEQLAQLLRLPFSSVSCTMGMSESQLSGWLLPRTGSHFEYVPSPFVESLQCPSVFLLDEMDASDSNVLLLINSVTSNGFMTIPHKFESPTVLRHPDSIIIAGANTTGSGADDQYSARTALDASTTDRFYTVAVDYDEAYEKSLFSISRKVKQRTPAWEAGPKVTQDIADSLSDWCFALRKKAKEKRIGRLTGTRLMQKAIAAAKARIPMEEIKTDLRLTWTADEIARTGI